MNFKDRKRTIQLDEVGRKIYHLIRELYPICRSMTGDGVRETLHLIGKEIPLAIHEIPSGTQVFDWTVPKEWNIRDAYVMDSEGERIIDFRKSNLHVVGYSVPVRKKMTLTELKKHLFTLPDQPEWIPFRTSYFKESWGFCLPHRIYTQLKDEEYDVCIDSSLEPGNLSYGEFYLQGKITDEVLISCHVCHPSLCNDNLSGIAVATYLAKSLSEKPVRYSYRFLFIPATIGSIAWLSLNERAVQKIRHGLVLACLGDAGVLTYKRSRRGSAEIDAVVRCVLRDSGNSHEVIDFFPFGYDERQFCSPGFNLPIGCLMRTPHGRFPEYHTSADNLDFVHPSALADSLSKCLSIIDVLESNRIYINLNPKCEPQLGRRGIYRAFADQTDGGKAEMALLWVLNLSDGQHSLLDIAEKSRLPYEAVWVAANLLLDHDLLKESSPNS